jgi:phosphate-selective porin
MVRWCSTLSFGSRAKWRRARTAAHGNDSRGPELSAKRVGIDGQLGKRLAFEVSLELTSSSPWRDVRALYDLPAGLTIAGGQFKVPLGLDATQSATKRDFVFRSRLADAYSIGRDQGISVEARLWRKRLTIEGGVFTGSSAKAP